jgi:hypothetical protein
MEMYDGGSYVYQEAAHTYDQSQWPPGKHTFLNTFIKILWNVVFVFGLFHEVKFEYKLWILNERQVWYWVFK